MFMKRSESTNLISGFQLFIDHHKNLWYTTPGSELGYLSFHQSGLDYIINRHKESARSLMEDHRKRVWIGWKRNHKTQPGNICLYDSLGQWIGNISQKENSGGSVCLI